MDGAGNFFIADRFGRRIRKVDGAGILTTVAGTGARGFSGDGGPATDAALNSTNGVAVDGAGNLFIADSGNNRIRKVDGAGIITTVAGGGGRGFSGDGGPATAAALRFPLGVAVDGAGNLFIADSSNNRIRKVDGAGIITTVAGTGAFGFSGGRTGHGCSFGLPRGRGGGWSRQSGDGGPATDAALGFPEGVAVDGAGNLFIANASSRRIRKVDGAGTITTVAGTGAFGFSGDGGPATAAALASPIGVAVDGAGNLFIADEDNRRIRAVRGIQQP